MAIPDEPWTRREQYYAHMIEGDTVAKPEVPYTREEMYLDAISGISDLTTFTVKGSVATTSALPASGNTVGDLYVVEADGSKWIWNGSKWVQTDKSAADLDVATTAEIQAVIDNYGG